MLARAVQGTLSVWWGHPQSMRDADGTGDLSLVGISLVAERVCDSDRPPLELGTARAASGVFHAIHLVRGRSQTNLGHRS